MNLPTLETLATLAAAMATPTEDPEVTAARALAIWRACDRKLDDMECIEPLRDAARKEETKFLARLGLNIFSVHSKNNDLVPLEKFLNACKPSPNTKSEDMRKMWRSFREWEIRVETFSMGQSQLSQSELLDAVAVQMETDRKDGLRAGAVPGYWRAFRKFVRKERKANLSERGKKGGRPKKSLAPDESASNKRQVKKSKP